MSMLEIEIAADNAAFDDDPGYEISRILVDLAFRIRHDGLDNVSVIKDINGNTVGNASWWDTSDMEDDE